MAESGTRCEIVYTFAMPYARMSTWPEMSRISRYLPMVFQNEENASLYEIPGMDPLGSSVNRGKLQRY